MSRLARFNQALTALGANPDFFWKYFREYKTREYGAEDHDLLMMEELERSEISFRTAIQGSFLWSSSPEGHDFWKGIAEKIKEYDDN